VFEEPLEVSERGWKTINVLWAVWFACLALANIYIARNFAESVWVNFKVFGISVAMLVFVIPQAIWLSGKIKQAAPKQA
jgi:intracellular septation protein